MASPPLVVRCPFYTGAADTDTSFSVREGVEGKRSEGGGTKGLLGREAQSRTPPGGFG